jgi:hypothetical protein
MTTDNSQPAMADDEFNADFDEFANAKDAQASAAASAGDDDASPALDEGHVDPANAPAPDRAGTTDAAAHAAAIDIWATAPPELRAAFEAERIRAAALEHADRSNRGRISTLQRQVNASATGAPPSDAPRGAAKVRAMLDSDSVKNAVSDYGEANAPLVEVMQAQQEILERFEARDNEIEQARTETYLTDQAAKVMSDHPDYNSIAKSTAFRDWYVAAPEGVRSMIERNAARIVDGPEVSSVVRLFKAETGISQTSTGSGRSSTDTIRARQLAGSRSVVNRGPGSSAAVPNEYDAAFDHFAAKRRS